MSGGGKAGGLPVAGGQNGRNILRSTLPKAHLYERAGKDAHHVVEEAAAAEFQAKHVSLPGYLDGVQPSDWEIMERYIAWTVLPVLALLLFVLGLQ